MSERIRRMKSREVEDLLKRHGFEFISQRGSHRKWRNDSRHLQVIVPEHTGRDLPIGSLRNILINAGIPESEWKD